ncbi:hypothetical protein ABZ468_07775 [Streptomyces sp. NPDC005708]|uniref:hypothetical protein n=1 Tax=Streptomyces sp. NPDC005708 TaxID=3154564 RepID=UPI003408CF37
MLRRDKDARLERALEGGPLPHDAENRRALAAAGALAPGHTRDPKRISQTRDAMMLAFQRALNPVEERDDAGSGDGLDDTKLHREEVALPGGGRLVLSDIEAISADVLEEAAETYARILESRSKDHQS